jgi:hypothetical protein
MVTIPQHGSNNELFDISCFLADIDLFAKPDTWLISIDQCMGEGALEIEVPTGAGRSLSDSEFRVLYSGIYQTIDGHFVGLLRGERLFELRAVDSSFWEVAGPPAFESHMLATYGAWR